MTELLTILADIFKSVSFVESAIFLVYLMIGLSVFFVFKVWFPHYLNNRAIENEREERKAQAMEAAIHNMTIILRSNTDVIEGFNRSISMLDDTLEKVSDKLYAHDAESKVIHENVKSVDTQVGRLKESLPDMNDMNRLQQRIDDVASKEDIKIMISKLDQLMEPIMEIKGKIS